VWLLEEPTFRRKVSHLSSRWKESSCFSCWLLLTLLVGRWLFSPRWWGRYVPLTRATRRHIPEDGIDHSPRREDQRTSYIRQFVYNTTDMWQHAASPCRNIGNSSTTIGYNKQVTHITRIQNTSKTQYTKHNNKRYNYS
jgi:hypothetical protein